MRSASSRCASTRARRRDHVVTFLAQRAAERLEDLLLVVGEQDAAGRHHDGHARARPARRSARSGCSCRCRACSATLMVPPRPSMMFLAIGRPRPVPARRVVKYGSKMRGRSSARDADAAIADRDGDAAIAEPGGATSVDRRAASGAASGAVPRAATAWRALVSRLTSTVRRRSPSVSIAGASDRAPRRPAVAAARPPTALAADRQSALTSVGAQIEADRPGEVEHLVDDAIEPIDFAVDVGGGVADVRRGRAFAGELPQRALDDHQRIADLVRDDGRHAAERGQPLALRRFALEAARSNRSAC